MLPKYRSIEAHLGDVRNASAQGVYRHLVSVLVFELCRLVPRSLHLRLAVCYHAGHDATCRLRQTEEVGDGVRVDQFVRHLE